ncbi:hypothetical protein PS2_013947 [Malus domestica]
MSVRTSIKHLQCHQSSPKPPQSKQDQQDPYSLLKQDPIEICSSLWVKAFCSPPTVAFPNLTGFLSKFVLWVLAYQSSCAHVTGTFPPTASSTPTSSMTSSPSETLLFGGVSPGTRRPSSTFEAPMTNPAKRWYLSVNYRLCSRPTSPASKTGLLRRFF